MHSLVSAFLGPKLPQKILQTHLFWQGHVWTTSRWGSSKFGGQGNKTWVACSMPGWQRGRVEIGQWERVIIGGFDTCPPPSESKNAAENLANNCRTFIFEMLHSLHAVQKKSANCCFVFDKMCNKVLNVVWICDKLLKLFNYSTYCIQN